MEQSTTILNLAFASFNIVVLCSIKPHTDLIQVQLLYSTPFSLDVDDINDDDVKDILKSLHQAEISLVTKC